MAAPQIEFDAMDHARDLVLAVLDGAPAESLVSLSANTPQAVQVKALAPLVLWLASTLAAAATFSNNSEMEFTFLDSMYDKFKQHLESAPS